MSLWCAYCDHDHGMHDGDGDGCSIVLVYLTEDRVPEWIDRDRANGGPVHLPLRMECTAYTPCGVCGDGGRAAVAERAACREAT